MAKIEVTKTELVWPGKYNEDGKRKEVPRVSLPFQVIESINTSRATREAEKKRQPTLFDIYEGKEGDTFEKGWKNKLIWGDNLLVMGSLLEKFAGKFDLIYIDPPFATGADFSIATEIGEGAFEIIKDQSIIEEKAYRDTWGMGNDSYMSMMYPRLVLIRELLSNHGSFFLHLGPNVSHYFRSILDEVFGQNSFRNDIIWKRTDAYNDPQQCGVIHDMIFFYSKSEDEWVWNTEDEFQPLPETTIKNWYSNEEMAKKDIVNRLGVKIGKGTKRYFNKADITGAGANPNDKPFKGVMPPAGRHWAYKPEVMEQLDKEGRIYYSKSSKPYEKRYLDESRGIPPQSIWSDISMLRGLGKHSESSEWLNYETQKPERLLERIIRLTSQKADLVGDFFCGSGTTLAVAEKLGRRWLGCDLGRYAIHVSRKRLLEIEGCKPFEILNLGKYERQYWQGVTFAGKGKGKGITEQALYEYLAFILKLYGAQPVAGLAHLHGKKGKAMVHIGAVDAPVTIDEINAAIGECVQVKQGELHILGWEWEMGLYDLMAAEAKKKGVKLLLLQIPREVMEQQAVDKGDVKFFELAYLEVQIKTPKKFTATVTLKDFVIPNTELIPEEVRSKVKKWSDYIDYWAVDWNFQNDTFMQGWVTYRTRKDRTLALTSDPYTYEKPGKYRILVKVVDIFGNDTSQAFELEV